MRRKSQGIQIELTGGNPVEIIAWFRFQNQGPLIKEEGAANLSFIHVSPPREHHKMIRKFRFFLYIVPESGK